MGGETRIGSTRYEGAIDRDGSLMHLPIPNPLANGSDSLER